MISPNQSKWTVRDVAPVGTWDTDAKIEVTGKEFEFLHNFSQMLQSFPMVCNSVYQRNLQNGTIKTQYLYPDGGTATDEHVKQFKEAMDMMQNRISSQVKQPAFTEGQTIVTDNAGAGTNTQSTEQVSAS
jgi:hypothetical protein